MIRTASMTSQSSTTHSKVFGINSDVKTSRNNNLNVRSGLSIQKTENGPFHTVTAAAESASFKLSSPKNSRIGLSGKISGPSASVTARAAVGGSGGMYAKASFAETSGSVSAKVFGHTVTLDGHVGIGASIGGEVSVSSHKVHLGGSASIMPGVYAGMNVDIRA